MILVLCTARSGSSLVTSMFAAHGLNFGEDAMLPQGYRSFEDQALKEHIRPMSNGPFDWATDKGGTADLVAERGLDIFKCGLEYWPAFEAMNPTVLKVYRTPASVAESLAEKKNLPFQYCLDVVYSRYQMLDQIPGYRVNSDLLIQRLYSNIEGAFRYCGIEFDRKKAKGVIRPGLWKH